MIATEGHDDRKNRRMLGKTATVSERAEQVVQSAVAVERPAARATLPPELRDAIVQMCAQAHADRLPVERMIVSLKERWGSHPNMRQLPRGVSEDSLLDCVITQCILDFYADDMSESASPRRLRTRVERSGPEQELRA